MSANLPQIIKDRYIDGSTNYGAGFFGCLEQLDNGKFAWFDSARNFDIAIHWCAMYAGESHLSSEEELDWMNEVGLERGYSVVHSNVLIALAEKELLV